MAAPTVESQRLISLSLGKIAQSRSQKGGINLHKNLLVATVLHKARTACMMEYQTLQRQRQLEFQLQQQKQQQQQQQQQKDAAALEFEAKQEQARSAALSLAAFNTSCQEQQQQQQSTIPTCVREMEEEEVEASGASATAPTASDPVPHDSKSNLGQPPAACVETGAAPLMPEAAAAPAAKVGQSADLCNKENSPPCQASADPLSQSTLDSEFDVELEDHEEETAAQVVPQSLVVPPPTDHLAAATQLAEDAAAGPADPRQRSQTSASPTCCNILKRQRDNWSAAHEQECSPATKKARVVATPARRESCSSRQHTSNTPEPVRSDCSSSGSPDQQHTTCVAAPDSTQISNLVSIFNSGFSGLCAVSAPSSNDHSVSPDSSACQYTTLSPASQSSLSCSSSLGRLDSLPSAIGLVLTV